MENQKNPSPFNLFNPDSFEEQCETEKTENSVFNLFNPESFQEANDDKGEIKFGGTNQSQSAALFGDKNFDEADDNGKRDEADHLKVIHIDLIFIC